MDTFKLFRRTVAATETYSEIRERTSLRSSL